MRLARGGLAACGRVAQRPERYPSAPARIPRSRRGEPRWSIEQNDLHSDALQKSRLRDANALDHKPALESRAYRLERLPAIGVRGRTKDFSKLLVVRLQNRCHRPIDVPGGERPARHELVQLRRIELLGSRRGSDAILAAKPLEEGSAQLAAH